MPTKKTNDRMRVFACIIYPESAPADFRERISNTHIECLLSPLHDKDRFLNEDGSDGELKKPHFHLLAYFKGKQSVEKVREIFESFGGVGLEVVVSKSGMTRYLCHLDNPEKPQYSTSDVRAFGGANFVKWAELDNDPMLFIGEIQDFIERHDIMSFYQLARYCRLYKPEWHKVISTRSTLYFERYIKSRAWEGSNVIDTDDTIIRWHEGEIEEGYEKST